MSVYFVMSRDLFLEYISLNMQNEKMCLAAVKENGLNLQFVFDKFKTKEVIDAAIEQNSEASLFVLPSREENIKNYYLNLIKENYNNISQIDERCKTPELCLSVVKQNGLALPLIFDQTPEICLAAVEQNGLAVAFVNNLSVKICLAAVKQNGLALSKIHPIKQTKEICSEAIKQNFKALQFVNYNLKTTDVCLIAIEQNWQAIEYIFEDERTMEICAITIKQNRRGFLYTPQKIREIMENKHQYIIIDIIKNDGLALQYIKFKTAKLCIAAVKQNKDAARYIPTFLARNKEIINIFTSK